MDKDARQIFTLILAILLAVMLLSAISSAHGECRFTQAALDGYSIIHYFGGRATYNIVEGIVVDPSWSHVISAFMFVTYEIYFDGYRNDFLGYGYDSEGADLMGDALIMFIGARDQYNVNKQIRMYASIKRDLYILGVQIKLRK